MKKVVIYLLIAFTCMGNNLAFSATLTESNTLFIWTEQNFPHYFSPNNAETQLMEEYTTRYYNETDTFIGTKDNSVYIWRSL